MMQFELQDLLFFLKNHKEPSTSFDIKNYVQFCSSNTRSFTHLKMKQPFLKLNCVRHFYFNRLPRLWNSIPPIDLDQSLPSIKHTLHTYFSSGTTFSTTSILICLVHFTVCVLVLNVQYYLCLIILIHLSPHSSANVMYNVLAVSVGLLIDHQYSIIFFSPVTSSSVLYCKAQ